MELPKETIERMFVESERDWPEDFDHENGKYQNRCMECKQTFMGHKRRVICKKCSTPDWIEISKRKPPEDTKDNKAWAGAWLEGEMVGYAKCMVDKCFPLQSEALRSLSEIEKLKEEKKEALRLFDSLAKDIADLRLLKSKYEGRCFQLESQNKELMETLKQFYYKCDLTRLSHEWIQKVEELISIKP